MRTHFYALVLYLGTLACGAVGKDYCMLRARDGAVLSLAEQVTALKDADVVFLGEEHDASLVHRLQLAVTEELLRLHGSIAISMEMFERDSQNAIDLYLAGSIDHKAFVDLARTWPNYPADYAPAIQLAKAHDLVVLASNVYRPLAARAARSGLAKVLGSPWAARQVDASPGPYRERFLQAMTAAGVHAEGLSEAGIQQLYASQCLKDDTMAESMARYFDQHGAAAAPLVHWCGRFHSDYGLGTVERLRRRRPDLKIAIISASKDSGLGLKRPASDRDRADFLWFVRP